jgi:hypothetical protein
MTMQVVAALSNVESLCIGEITEREADLARGDNPDVDGVGLYLISVDARRPSEPGAVLAKFTSEDAARKLAQFFRLSGRMELAV